MSSALNRFLSFGFFTVFLGFAHSAIGQTAPAVASASAPALPTAWEFAKAPAIEGLSLSPDGSHMAAITSPDGITRYISIWETANPDKAPVVLGASKMRLKGVSFIKNDRIIAVAQQLFTAGSTKTHLYKIYITDLKGEKWTSALPEASTGSEDEQFADAVSNPSLLSDLPDDPNHVIVMKQGLDGAGDVYKVDVYSGAIERIARASDRFGGPSVDRTGEIRAREEVNFDHGNVYLAQWIKNPKTGAWEEHFRSFAKDRNLVSVVGFTKDPNIIYISKRDGGDKSAIFEYDIAARKILEPVFAHKLFDAGGPRFNTAGDLVGFTYDAERSQTYWTDERLATIAKGLKVAFNQQDVTIPWMDGVSEVPAKLKYGAASSVRITDWSNDLKYVIAERDGPNLPQEYYLLTEGTKLTLLGKARASLDVKAIGESQVVQYKARDGLTIPAFLHMPSAALYGPGPYAAVVLPHGGPSARDNYDWDFSGWTKFLTSRGYVVIQPQFRGSVGWGEKLARAGDAQWGKTMQDDNDDAAKWLIAQGYAKPDRIALFGYSYGGYAGYLAAIRPNGLYQCSIAAAGVAQIKRFQGETYDNRFLREYQRPTIDGVDPLSNASQVSIPIFIYHGDRDQIVEIEESRRFVAALKAAGKTYKYLEIPDMGHTFDTWQSKDGELQLLEIEKYLKNDCGPGGL
jgi:dipeptidyl aminopeptidase/acylaminoacyl peptidase